MPPKSVHSSLLTPSPPVVINEDGMERGFIGRLRGLMVEHGALYSRVRQFIRCRSALAA